MKINDAIAQFLSHCEHDKNLAGQTLKAYSIDLQKFLLFAGTKKSIKKCDSALLRSYMSHLLDDCALKETSVKRRLASLKVFCRWMELHDMIPVSPFHRVDARIKLPRQIPKGLSKDEIRILIQSTRKRMGVSQGAAYGQRPWNQLEDIGHFNVHTALVSLEILFSTGLRVGELVNLTQEDINMKEGSLSIAGTGVRERKVFIPDEEIKSLLKAYLKRRNSRKPETKALLINSKNQPASTQFIRKLIRQAGETAGLKNRITPYMLRHATATHLLDAGVEIRRVQRLLGHSTIISTNTYTQLSDSSLKKAIFASHPRKQILKR